VQERVGPSSSVELEVVREIEDAPSEVAAPMVAREATHRVERKPAEALRRGA
jgi:hypothetical protein